MNKPLALVFALALAVPAMLIAAPTEEGAGALPADFDPQKPWEAFKDEPITLDIWVDGGWPFPEVTNNPDSWLRQKMREDTGVTVDLRPGAGWGPEGLNLFIASGEYPDIMLLRQATQPTQILVENDVIYSWNEIKDLYGIDVMTEMNINTRFNQRLRYGRDDLYISAFYSIPDRYLDSPWVVKFMSGTMINDTVYEQMGRPPIDSMDAMVDAAVQARNMYPDRFRHPVMDVRNAGVENRWNLPHNIDRWRVFYDLRNPEDYNTAGEPHRFFFQTDAFVDMLQDLNHMESLGLFNPIIWTTTESQEKLALLNRGEIFIEGEDDADNVGGRTRSLQEIYPGERYAFLPRFSADPAKYRNYPSGRVSVGWLGLTLPKNKENTLRAAAYVAYLMSEYFQKLQQFGEEGVHHDVVDGWPAMKPEIQAEYQADRTVAGLKYNFNLWHGAFRDDFWAMVKRQQEQQSMVEALNVIQPALENFQDTSVSAEAAPVNYETDSEELKIYSAIREVLGDGATRIVLQSDDVAGDYAALLERIEELGVGVLNDLHTQHMIDFDALIEKYNY